MPLPFLLLGGAIVTGVGGVGAGIHGGVKMKQANDTIKLAKGIMDDAQLSVEKHNKKTLETMDAIGKKELDILASFKKFSDVMEKIQGRPEFTNFKDNKFNLPKYSPEELTKVSIGAGVLIGGMGGAAVGVAGGIASSGATTAAVMALGTASTGTAISTLSGAAATNATLAALGGGAIGSTTAAGGMALGTTVLGASTLGVGLLIGGVVFNFTGKKMANKADEAYRQAKKSEKEAEEICSYLENLDRAALRFSEALKSVSDIYERNLRDMETIVISLNRTNWNDFNDREKKICENTALLVGYLYKMCRVAIVKNENNSNGFNTINYDEVNSAITESKKFVKEIA